MPFELIGNRPIITLKVNGNDAPLRFVLDTGSGISVISEATAKRLKIKSITKGGFARGIGGDGKFEIVLAGEANRNQLAFEDKFKVLADSLQQHG